MISWLSLSCLLLINLVSLPEALDRSLEGELLCDDNAEDKADDENDAFCEGAG